MPQGLILMNIKWREFIKHFTPHTLFGGGAVVYVPKISAGYKVHWQYNDDDDYLPCQLQVHTAAVASLAQCL